MNTSRKKRRTLPKESRTLPIKGNKDRGDGRDDGRYFECWNCGFICDIEGDSLGGPESGSGVALLNHSVTSYGYNGDPKTGFAVLGGSIEHFHVALEKDADGSPKEVLHSFSASDGIGCPFCHSLNWKGDYP